jgi:hypothetical protein
LSGNAQIQLQAVDNFGVKWIIVSINPASDPNKKPALRSWLLNRPPYIVNFDTTKVRTVCISFPPKPGTLLNRKAAPIRSLLAWLTIPSMPPR